jgi:hypothetical protein
MVFNGPLMLPFGDRGACLDFNCQQFSAKRDFCIIPFAVLLAHAQQSASDKSVAQKLWRAIHSTAGVLQVSENST